MSHAHDREESADDVRFADALGFVLGADPGNDASFREALDLDPTLLLETAELKELVEDFRSLEVQPTGHVPLRVWPQVRNHAIRQGHRPRYRLRKVDRLTDVAAVLGVAAVLLIGLVLVSPRKATKSRKAEAPTFASAVAPFGATPSGSGAAGGDQIASGWEELRRSDRLPIDDLSFSDAYHSIADRPIAIDGVPSQLALTVSAENLLTRLRRDARLRSEAGERRRQERALAVPDLDRPIERLADDVADRLAERLAFGSAAGDDSEAVVRATMVRSLLAAGSTLRSGPHHDVLLRGAADLLRASEVADPRALGPIGVALCDLAALEGAPFDTAVRSVTDRLLEDTFHRPTAVDEGSEIRRVDRPTRGALLAWSTPPSHLAEAGRVLQLAPAFGAAAGPCFRGRLLTLAHLVEREQRPGRVDPPDVLTAQLYGFGDLIDRFAVDDRLSLWTVRSLMSDMDTAVQLAWSRYPIRRGWAQLQQELMQFATYRAPKADEEAASMLLILATNVAAPGVSEALARAEKPRRSTRL